MTLAFTSRRSPILANHHMVATSQPLAVAAGLEILDAGGNAADAAIATSAALCVTEPCSNGLGGDGFALYHDGSTVHALNASGRSPAALDLERIARDGFDLGPEASLPPTHAHTITVPGLCSGWCALHQRFGHLPLPQILSPAIRLAQEGFPVAPITAFHWDLGAHFTLAHAAGGQAFLPGGRAPRAGERFRNPALAHVLRRIAEDGKEAFYTGEIAAAIEARVQGQGGVLTTADLAEHEATWVQPIACDYRGVRVWECPPNGQGLTALLALRLLHGFDIAALEPLGDERLHLQIEALRLAFSDGKRVIADPDFAPAPIPHLLSEAYTQSRRALISKRASSGGPSASSDTVYLCVIDRDGNACSFIDSNYMGFGTGMVPEGCGFTLQNRGHGFSLDPAHAGRLEPRKRPYHTIIPGMLTHTDDALIGPFGVMGGFMQPQGHVQVVNALIDDALDPQAALDRPRFCIQADGSVALEDGISSATEAALRKRGHNVHTVTGHGRALFGRGQILWRSPEGVLWGGSDPRADGCAMGR